MMAAIFVLIASLFVVTSVTTRIAKRNARQSAQLRDLADELARLTQENSGLRHELNRWRPRFVVDHVPQLGALCASVTVPWETLKHASDPAWIIAQTSKDIGSQLLDFFKKGLA